jgi:hypothetical protein
MTEMEMLARSDEKLTLEKVSSIKLDDDSNPLILLSVQRKK